MAAPLRRGRGSQWLLGVCDNEDVPARLPFPERPGIAPRAPGDDLLTGRGGAPSPEAKEIDDGPHRRFVEVMMSGPSLLMGRLVRRVVELAPIRRSRNGRILTMMVTEKGQVTIPKALRDELGILPGTEVEFAVQDEHLVVRKAPEQSRGARVVSRMRGRGAGAMSTDEILALTRSYDADE